MTNETDEHNNLKCPTEECDGILSGRPRGCGRCGYMEEVIDQPQSLAESGKPRTMLGHPKDCRCNDCHFVQGVDEALAPLEPLEQQPCESRRECRTFLVTLHCPCGGEFKAKDGKSGMGLGPPIWYHHCDRCKAVHKIKDPSYPRFEHIPIPIEIPEDAAPHISMVVTVRELVKQMAGATAESYMKTVDHKVLDAMRALASRLNVRKPFNQALEKLCPGICCL